VSTAKVNATTNGTAKRITLMYVPIISRFGHLQQLCYKHVTVSWPTVADEQVTRRIDAGRSSGQICHWEMIGVSTPACESMEFPCPPAPDSQVNTGGTSSAKKYVTAS
jgi:hypothetical protein